MKFKTQDTRIKQGWADNIFDIINYTLLALTLIVYLYPLLYIVVASISDPNALYTGENMWLIPKQIQFDGYAMVMKNNNIWRSYLNTIIYTVFGTIFNLILTFTAAYPLSRRDFKAKNFIMAVYTVTMFFGGGLIPSYFLMKSLGLVNNPLVMIIAGGVGVYNIIVVRTFFQSSIPYELWEAAEMDGCTDIKYFLKVVIPLSMPIIAVMTLFCAVGHWNDYFTALIYLSKRTLYPLQLVLREILINSEMDKSMLFSQDATSINDYIKVQKTSEMLKYCVIIVSTLPILMVYPFIQKHFVKGVMVGSIKG